MSWDSEETSRVGLKGIQALLFAHVRLTRDLTSDAVRISDAVK